jgi:hypothetical protein
VVRRGALKVFRVRTGQFKAHAVRDKARAMQRPAATVPQSGVPKGERERGRGGQAARLTGQRRRRAEAVAQEAEIRDRDGRKQ